MALIRPIPSASVELTSYHSSASQSAVTYTAANDQDVIIFCRFSVFAGTSTIVAAGDTVYSTTTTSEALYTSSKIHLSAGDTVVASGNSAQYLGIATTGTGSIA